MTESRSQSSSSEDTRVSPATSDFREIDDTGSRGRSPFWIQLGQPPSAAYVHDGAEFEVFTVKTDEERWPDSVAARVAERCRRSRRHMYGERAPLLDSYDNKANVYLVRCCYHDDASGNWFEEWMTTRNIPLIGDPHGLEEFELYRSLSRPTVSVPQLLVEAGLAESEEQAVRTAFANGGTGAIRPISTTGEVAVANRYSGESMLVAVKQFLDEDEARGNRCQTLLFQIPPKLAVRYRILPMSRVEEACGLPAGDVVLDRRNAIARELCYGVPAYFLEAEDVARLVGGLISAGLLADEVVREVLPSGRSVADFLRRPKFSDLRSFGELLGASSPRNVGRIDVELLRVLADAAIRAAPALWFFHLDGVREKAKELVPRLREADIERAMSVAL